MTQAEGHRHLEETAEHCPHSTHRTEGCSIASWHWGSPRSPSLPRAHTHGVLGCHRRTAPLRHHHGANLRGQGHTLQTEDGVRSRQRPPLPDFSPRPRVPKTSSVSPTVSPSLTLLHQHCLPHTRHHRDPGSPTGSEPALGLGEARSGLQCRGVSRTGCGMPTHGDELLRSPAGPRWSVMEFLLIVGGLPRDDAPSLASIN